MVDKEELVLVALHHVHLQVRHSIYRGCEWGRKVCTMVDKKGLAMLLTTLHICDNPDKPIDTHPICHFQVLIIVVAV